MTVYQRSFFRLPLHGLFWAGLALGLCGSAKAASPKDEFLKIEADMEEATESFFESLAQLADEKGKTVARDTAKLPADPRPAILRKMDALAQEQAHSSDGDYIAGHTFLWAIDVAPESLFGRFENLVSHFPDSEVLAYALESVPYAYQESAPPTEWTKLLDTLATKTANAETKFASLLAIGRIYMAGGKPDAAKASLKRLQLAAAKTIKSKKSGGNDLAATYAEDYGKIAKGLMFELEHLRIGMPAPGFTTKTVDGQTISLKSLRGQVVLLDFWATWCGPCVAEIPNLKKVTQALQGKPFEILAVSIDDNKHELQRLIKSSNAPGIHTWDPQGSENPVGLLYNVERLPTWYLIDQKGIIRARDPQSDKLIELVGALLQKPSAAKDTSANHAASSAEGR